MRNLITNVLLALLVAGTAAGQGDLLDPARGRRVTIGIVLDGPMPDDRVIPLVRDELDLLSGGTARIRFLEDDAFDGGWTPEGATRALKAALRDRRVDTVLAYGHLVGQAAAGLELTKPVVSAMVQRADLYGLHDTEGNRSLKKNLSFVLIPLRAEADLHTAVDLFHVDEVNVAVRAPYLEGVPKLRREVAALEEASGKKANLVPVDHEIPAVVESLAEGGHPVIFAELPGLSREERRALIRGLNGRGIRTYSLRGHKDVQLGALASRTPDFDLFLARRVALNLNELVRGRPVNDLPVVLPVDSRLLINASTALDVGFKPDLQTMAFARFLNPEALRPRGTPLSLEGAMQTAGHGNLDLAISDQDIETRFRERQNARSTMFPQIDASATYENIKIPGLEGIIPDNFGRVGVRLGQMIYDDRRVSDFRSADSLWLGSQEFRDQTRFDVMALAGTSYLNLVLSQVLYKVEADNLRLTEENLELAKLRELVGYSGRDEVFRWQAEVAKRQRELLDAESRIEVNRVALNQILNVDQAIRWETSPIQVDDKEFPFVDGRLKDDLTDMHQARQFVEASVEMAVENSPELKFYDYGIEAQDTQLRQRKRRYYLPVFSTEMTWNYDFYRNPDLNDVDKDGYRIAILGTIPIFEGGGRAQEIARVSSELNRLQKERMQARNLLERRTRESVSRMAASFYSIRLNRIAAENARKNLELVQEKYTQGLVNVTDLLGAQNESFTAQQAAEGANYEFLADLIEYQRSISWYEWEKTPEERERVADRIKSGIEDRE